MTSKEKTEADQNKNSKVHSQGGRVTEEKERRRDCRKGNAGGEFQASKNIERGSIVSKELAFRKNPFGVTMG